jgi:putative transposase
MPRRNKFSDAEIIAAIKEIEAGATVTQTARKLGVSMQTMLRYRAKFGGMEVSEVQEKRRLEEENRRLSRLVTKYALENEALKEALGKKW